ncbi:hypothetical protein DH2020_015562 [Rehmannia glutinosa]|uniref:Uncharacterized protein n=1 Tax=Rehmannia glutinosa TaxID=99300 RepID=A0ABR0WX76_REHGL
MEVFDVDNNVIQAKKSSLNSKISSLGEIKKLFRVVEIFLVLVSVTWASSRLPFAVKISGEYFRQLLNVVVSHLFVFLLSNVIVVTLFFKSRHLFPQQEFRNTGENMDFCQQLIIENIDGAGESSTQAEDVVYQDKQTILEVTKVKVHRRSQSENGMSLEEDDRDCGKRLRRSETERRRRVEEEVEMVDELSNEEFQRAIDEFIAKQIKFHQQEKLTIVLHDGST